MFNLKAVQVSDEWIICQSPIYALTFWCAGYLNVICTYGLETPHHDLLDLPKRLLIAYEASLKGEQAAQLLHQQLASLAIETYRIEFPKGLDANEYAVKSNNTPKVLGDAIRQAV